MNKEIVESKEWISKRDVAKSFGVDVRTLELIVEKLNKETGFIINKH